MEEINLNNARIENGILILESGEEITEIDIGVILNLRKTVYGKIIFNPANQKEIEKAAQKGFSGKNVLKCLKKMNN